ncbi:gamma-glutamyltransferase [Thermomicrobium sp. 4228-Ro]|uniref:gamma-glutamyltransferase n=1 Tax=Thermomicrobium sp. 4228-Ro TaxID=2993937 RepID=UPI0022495B96|nr:gamma-glutamyltransferase [Thermomicrobium sp. 4228-Ro]MCX2726560.1 gamma-glutamyltransferase [Thermomicrobium sp. 4228-Ro]
MSRSKWIIDRTEAVGRHGMVVAQHELAAEVGVAVLADGGNAIDAAVATAFAIGVVEPFMSGIGGGGILLIHLAESQETVAIDFGMCAPLAARPDLYRLLPATGATRFGWRAVEKDANVHGPLAIAVPGMVAGLATALERYGTRPLAELLQPAIRLARDGFAVSWHTSLEMAQDAALLAQYPSTRAVFTRDGLPLPVRTGLEPTILRQPDLARSLEAIARDGADAFYRGELGRQLVEGLRALGAILTMEDLERYTVRLSAPLWGEYRGYRIATAPAPSGGPTVLESLHLLDCFPLTEYGHNSSRTLHVLIEAFRQAFVDRFAYLADPGFVPVPVAALTDPAYARERASEIGEQARARIEPGDPRRLGVQRLYARSLPNYGAGSTTHIGVVDRWGNAVALTQTLLSAWGSRVVAPGTGILMNNGMLWFDPEPGRANSIEPGKRPLANMSPTLVFQDDGLFLVLGAMGGRRIIDAVAQVVSNVIDHGLGIQAAISAPRIDCSVEPTAVSSRIDGRVISELERRGHRVQIVREDFADVPFACPGGILRDRTGTLHGGSEPYYPGMAIGLA